MIRDFDYGNVPASFSKYTGLAQVGSTITATHLEMRDMSGTFLIMADDLARVSAAKERIDAVLNPAHTLRLRFTRPGVQRQIYARANGTPIYSTNIKTCNSWLLEWKCDFQCFYPYFSDCDETLVELSSLSEGLVFPATFPMALRHRETADTLLINDGHVPTPVRIVFYGPATKPKILHEESGQHIELDEALTSNQVLTCTTDYGNKRAVITEDGTDTNASNVVTFASRYFELSVGDNHISYQNGDSNLPQRVQLYFRRLYNAP